MNKIISGVNTRSPYTQYRKFTPKLDWISIINVQDDTALDIATSKTDLIQKISNHAPCPVHVGTLGADEASVHIKKSDPNVGGIYLLMGALTNQHILEMEARDLPFVIVDYATLPGQPPSIEEGRNCVKMGFSHLMRAAIERLHQKGATRIGFLVEGSEYAPAKEAIIDFPHAVKRQDLSFDPTSLMMAKKLFSDQSLHTMLENFVNRRQPESQGIVISNLSLAKRSLQFLEDAGIKQEQIIAINALNETNSSLTTVEPDWNACLDSIIQISTQEVFKMNPHDRFHAKIPFTIQTPQGQ